MATIAIGISKKPGGTYTCEVPLAALSEDGVPPEEGDTVQYSVEGKVQSVSGDTATVEIDTVNGEPVGEEGSESPEEEGAEPESGTENPGGGGATPSPPNPGPNPASKAGLAPMGPAPAASPIRSRLDRAGTNLMRAKLMKGARGRPMPF